MANGGSSARFAAAVRTVGCITATLVLLGCGQRDAGSARTAEPTSSPLCDTYHDGDSDDWVLASDPDSKLAEFAEGSARWLGSIIEHADGELQDVARQAAETNALMYQLWQSERASAGGGPQLTERARDQGFSTTEAYITSIAAEHDGFHDRAIRDLRWQLAVECDDFAPADPQPLSDSDAPEGELLVVKLGEAEIRRFSPTGEDLGALPLPPEVAAPLTHLTVSPDGRRLAFIGGGDEPQMWTTDLVSGDSTASTVPACMDWAVDGSGFWASVDTVPNEFVTLIGGDGMYDPSDDLESGGCPYRFDTDTIAIAEPAEDGGPVGIALTPIDGSAPTNLVDSPCDLVAPRISPDSGRFVLTVGCAEVPASGAYVVDADGANFRQVFGGTAAAASWSLDGNWIAFGTDHPSAPNDTTKLHVIISSLDGTTLGAVTPPGYSWPVWVPSPTARS